MENKLRLSHWTEADAERIMSTVAELKKESDVPGRPQEVDPFSTVNVGRRMHRLQWWTKKPAAD